MLSVFTNLTVGRFRVCFRPLVEPDYGTMHLLEGFRLALEGRLHCGWCCWEPDRSRRSDGISSAATNWPTIRIGALATRSCQISSQRRYLTRVRAQRRELISLRKPWQQGAVIVTDRASNRSDRGRKPGMAWRPSETRGDRAVSGSRIADQHVRSGQRIARHPVPELVARRIHRMSEPLT